MAGIKKCTNVSTIDIKAQLKATTSALADANEGFSWVGSGGYPEVSETGSRVTSVLGSTSVSGKRSSPHGVSSDSCICYMYISKMARRVDK